MNAFFPFDATWLHIFGIAAAVLSLIAYLPYMCDVARGKTEPQRASWLIWSLLSTLAFAAQWSEGASTTLWFAGAQMTGTLSIFLMSLACGRGPFLKPTDQTVLWLAAGGLLVWYVTDTAAYALALTITISLLGGALTVLKAARDPSSETLVTWGLSFVAACCAICAGGAGGWLMLAYPAYLFALNGAIVCAILFGRIRGVRGVADGRGLA